MRGDKAKIKNLLALMDSVIEEAVHAKAHIRQGDREDACKCMERIGDMAEEASIPLGIFGDQSFLKATKDFR